MISSISFDERDELREEEREVASDDGMSSVDKDDESGEGGGELMLRDQCGRCDSSTS